MLQLVQLCMQLAKVSIFQDLKSLNLDITALLEVAEFSENLCLANACCGTLTFRLTVTFV